MSLTREQKRRRQRIRANLTGLVVLAGAMAAGALLGGGAAYRITEPVQPAKATFRSVVVQTMAELYEEPEEPELVIENPTPLSDDLYLEVCSSSESNQIPLYLALGLIEVESSFDPYAVSPKGCYGLFQINPKYHPSNLSPKENIKYGIEFLSILLEQYGDTEAALTAYNAGHDTGNREYAQKVLESAEKWESVVYAT